MKPSESNSEWLQDETTVIGEWMWVRVSRCDEKQLVFGTLDNELVDDYGKKMKLGSELAVSYAQIREHKKPSEFSIEELTHFSMVDTSQSPNEAR